MRCVIDCVNPHLSGRGIFRRAHRLQHFIQCLMSRFICGHQKRCLINVYVLLKPVWPVNGKPWCIPSTKARKLVGTTILYARFVFLRFCTTIPSIVVYVELGLFMFASIRFMSGSVLSCCFSLNSSIVHAVVSFLNHSVVFCSVCFDGSDFCLLFCSVSVSALLFAFVFVDVIVWLRVRLAVCLCGLLLALAFVLLRVVTGVAKDVQMKSVRVS